MEALSVLIGFACLGLGLYLPIRFFKLIGEVKSLEQRLAVLDKRLPVSPANSVAEPSVAAPVPSVASAPTAPPPLPPTVVQPAAPVRATVAQPDPLSERLRDLGLLPPADLKGEYALGAWWAVRVGGVLAVAAVAYVLTNWNSGGPAVAGVKGESKGTATAGSKADAKAAAKGGPGGPGGGRPDMANMSPEEREKLRTAMLDRNRQGQREADEGKVFVHVSGPRRSGRW